MAGLLERRNAVSEVREAPDNSMEREQEEFDAAGFLELLGDSLRERLHDDEARTGVLTARIHIRRGQRCHGITTFATAAEPVATPRSDGDFAGVAARGICDTWSRRSG